ncbi:hypothetical protein ACWGIB_23605 [Streptomyces xiamenensis]
MPGDSPCHVYVETDLVAGWTEKGRCLMCDRSGVDVLWLGPVINLGRAKPFHACIRCTERLTLWVRDVDPPRGPTHHVRGFLRLIPTTSTGMAAPSASTAITMICVAALAASVASVWWAFA